VALLLVVLLAGTAVGAPLWVSGELAAADRDSRAERLDEAGVHVQRCLVLWPWNPSVHLVAARIARLSSDYPEAEAQLAECRRLEHGVSEPTRLEMAMLLAQQGDVDSAAPLLRNAIEHNHPDAPLMLDALVTGYAQKMRLRAALGCLDRWLKLEPDNVRALDWRGWVWEQADERDAAAADYRRALELQPGRDDVRRRLGALLLLDNNVAEALPHYELLWRTQSGQPEVKVGMAWCRRLQGRLDEARRLLDEVLDADPRLPAALVQRGKVEFDDKRYAEAEKYLRRALAEQPNGLDANFTLYNVLYAQSGREAEAETQLARNESLKADTARLTALLIGRELESGTRPDEPAEFGAILLKRGDARGAYWLEKVALARDRNYKPALKALAEYYGKNGPAAQAQEYRDRLARAEAP
jgi:tetratricopeptide (TPR) repeat protein